MEHRTWSPASCPKQTECLTLMLAVVNFPCQPAFTASCPGVRPSSTLTACAASAHLFPFRSVSKHVISPPGMMHTPLQVSMFNTSASSTYLVDSGELCNVTVAVRSTHTHTHTHSSALMCSYWWKRHNPTRPPFVLPARPLPAPCLPCRNSKMLVCISTPIARNC